MGLMKKGRAAIRNKRATDWLEQNYNLKRLKGQRIDISNFPEYKEWKGQNIYIEIGPTGSITNIRQLSEKELKREQTRRDIKDPMDKEFDKHVKSKAKKKKKKGFEDVDKNKEQLKKLKEDPKYLREEIDKLILAYDAKKLEFDKYLDKKGMLLEDITAKDPVHAKARKLQNQLKTTTFKLYDKAKTYSGITGEDEKARAFQHVVGRQFEEELPGNVPTPQFQPNPNVQKRTDEELLRELQQLRQRK